jgi:PKD repeat protein
MSPKYFLIILVGILLISPVMAADPWEGYIPGVIANDTMPVNVTFNSTISYNNPTAWNWSFRDITGNNTEVWFSTSQTPFYSFNTSGNYSIVLNVSNSYGYNISPVMAFVNISPAAIPPSPVTITSNVTAGVYPLSVQFNDSTQWLSTTSYNWSLNGSWQNGTTQNASVTYSTGGKYDVFLKKTNTSFTNTSNYITISVYNQTKSVISKNTTSGLYTRVAMYNASGSLNVTMWNWSYNNGAGTLWSNGTGVVTNLTITYATGGNFSTTLNTSDSNYGYSQNTSYIDIWNHTTSQISSNVTSGNSPLAVQFNGTGSNVTTWNWTFGAANFSNLQNTTYTFTGVSSYTVVLNTSNGYDFNITTLTNMITVLPIVPPIPNFTANKTYGAIPFTVLFNDTGSKTTIIAWNWSFGDGSYSGVQSPVKVYSDIGLYDVTLTIQNASGVNSTTKVGYINTTSAPYIVADFAAAPTTAIQSSTSVLFGDNSAGTIDNWSWNFGDGSTSYIQNPSHTYYTSGLYTVSLTTSSTVFGVSDTKTRTNYIIVSNSTAPPTYNTSVSQLDLPNSSPQWNWYYYLAVTNKTGPNWEFPIVSFAYGLVYPFTNAFEQVGGNQFGNVFYLILWGLFLIMVYKNSGRVGVVAIMAVLTAGAWSMLAPASSMPWVLCLIAAALASQVITLITKKD